MKHKKKIWIYALSLLGVVMFVVSSCKKDDDPELATLTTTAVSEITSANAISGGTITDNGGAAVTVRGVCWNTSPNPTIANNKTEDGAGSGSFTSNLTGLEPNTTYYVRAYATNEAGTAYGNELEFTTELGASVPVLTTANVTEIDRNTAVSGGEVTSDGGAEVTMRGVCWSTDQNPTVDDNKTEDGDGTGSFTSDLTGLESGTTYYVRAYATNVAGTGYGDEVEFTTLQEGIVTDIDGNVYQTTIIGGQEWMAENLRVRNYNTGEPIPTNLDNDAWTTTYEGAYTIFDFNNTNAGGIDSEEQMAATYGLLYNWFAVDDSRGLCPAGWRVPSSEEWNALTNYIIDTEAGIDTMNVAMTIKSCRQVNSPMGGDCATEIHPFWREDVEHYGTDIYGFGALPAGFRHNTSGNYSWLTSRGYYWSSTEFADNPESANYRRMYFSHSEVEQIATNKRIGFSVRCIKN